MNEIPWRFHASGAAQFIGFFPPISTSGRGSYSRASQDYVDRFYAYFRQWKSETQFASSFHEVFANKSFRSLVAMGEMVIPLILGEIERSGDSFIAYALELITKERPYDLSTRGNIKAINEAWLSWGETHGY